MNPLSARRDYLRNAALLGNARKLQPGILNGVDRQPEPRRTVRVRSEVGTRAPKSKEAMQELGIHTGEVRSHDGKVIPTYEARNLVRDACLNCYVVRRFGVFGDQHIAASH